MSKRRRRRTPPDREERRAERREELLDAAATAIRRDGPGVSMDEMAAEAGVTKPILYRHFSDRAGLVRALGDRFASQLIGELTTALGRGGDPRELLEGTIDAYVRFIERNPEIYGFLVQEAFPEDPKEMVGVIREVARRVALVLGEGLRGSGYDSGAAEPWAHGMVGMVHLAGHWWVETRTMPRSRLVDYLTTLLWSGLGSAAPDVISAGDAGLAGDQGASGSDDSPTPSGAVTEPTPIRRRKA